MRKFICSILCCVLLLGVLAGAASAMEVPDYSRRGSISVTMTCEGSPVPGGSLTLYRVGGVVRDDGSYLFAYTQDYAACPVPVEDLSSQAAQALAKIANEKKIQGTRKSIGAQGKVTFSDLEIGLYLLVQDTPAGGYNAAAPFLVSLPSRKDGGYVYEVDASPKLELERAPTVPTEPQTPPSGKLPQTGQLNWPVPVLLTAGLALIAGGWYLTKTGKKQEHET